MKLDSARSASSPGSRTLLSGWTLLRIDTGPNAFSMTIAARSHASRMFSGVTSPSGTRSISPIPRFAPSSGRSETVRTSAGERVGLGNPFVLSTVDPGTRDVAGSRVAATRRVGKRIVLALEDDLFIVIHLMIAGRFRWLAPNAKIPGKLGLAAFDFDDGTLLLTEAGSKRRASIHIVRGWDAVREHDAGGIEPLEITRKQFQAALTRERHTLKRTLTDPHVFAGIGNAYSDEILHRARLSPVQMTTNLDDEEITRLYEATQ